MPRYSRLTKAEIAGIFDRFASVNPHPEGELDYLNPYHASRRRGAVGAGDRCQRQSCDRSLFQRVDTPEKMVELGEAGLISHIRSIGLYRNKAKKLSRCRKALIASHGGAVPRDREALEALPGVGRKTANVVLNTASASRPSRSTRISSGLAIAPAWRRARRRSKSSSRWRRSFRRNASAMPIIGSSSWPLHLQGARARMPALPDPRYLPLQAEDAGSRSAAAICLKI